MATADGLQLLVQHEYVANPTLKRSVTLETIRTVLWQWLDSRRPRDVV